ncbi:MAG: hypothetical protein ABGW69_00280 [Nanoarchaeota archaeon]
MVDIKKILKYLGIAVFTLSFTFFLTGCQNNSQILNEKVQIKNLTNDQFQQAIQTTSNINNNVNNKSNISDEELIQILNTLENS